MTAVYWDSWLSKQLDAFGPVGRESVLRLLLCSCDGGFGFEGRKLVLDAPQLVQFADDPALDDRDVVFCKSSASGFNSDGRIRASDDHVDEKCGHLVGVLRAHRGFLGFVARMADPP